MKWMIAVLCGLSFPAFLLTRDWFCEKFGPDAYIVNRAERRENAFLGAIGCWFVWFCLHDGPTFVFNWGSFLGYGMIGCFGGAIWGMWAFNDRFQLIMARNRLENPRRSIPEALPAPTQIEAAPITLEHDDGFAFDPARFGKANGNRSNILPAAKPSILDGHEDAEFILRCGENVWHVEKLDDLKRLPELPSSGFIRHNGAVYCISEDAMSDLVARGLVATANQTQGSKLLLH